MARKAQSRGRKDPGAADPGRFQRLRRAARAQVPDLPLRGSRRHHPATRSTGGLMAAGAQPNGTPRVAMLSGCRVLDLTTERGLMCGQILGDLGADVIKIEPPGGSPVRSLAPFFADEPGPERSVYWWAYNRNKRGITLDLETAEGR